MGAKWGWHLEKSLATRFILPHIYETPTVCATRHLKCPVRKRRAGEGVAQGGVGQPVLADPRPAPSALHILQTFLRVSTWPLGTSGAQLSTFSGPFLKNMSLFQR